MPDHLTKKLLTFMADESHPAGTRFSLCSDWDDYCNVPFHDLLAVSGVSEDSLLAAIDYMADRKALTYCTISGNIFGCKLAHTGLNWREFRVISAKERWSARFWGFVSGVIVGLIPWLLSVLRG